MRFDWAALNESSEQLRLTTARLKCKRLQLHAPGVLLRVRQFAVLTIVKPFTNPGIASIVSYERGELLLVVHINLNPKQPIGGNLVDPVEAFFIGKGGAIVTTGTRAAADIFIGYDVV